MKSGNLNFLEPSGPLQACNGTALPFYKTWLPNPVVNKMKPVHTFQTSCSRLILVLTSHLYISLSSVLCYSGPPTGILYWYLYAFHEWYIFHTSHHDILVCGEEYKLLICYAVCLPSCHFQSCLCVLHYTTHFTSLICRYFYVFCI